MNSLMLRAAVLAVLQAVTLACSVKVAGDGSDGDGVTSEQGCNSGWEYNLRASSVMTAEAADLVAVAATSAKFSVALTADGRLLAPLTSAVFEPVEQPASGTLRAVAMGAAECPELQPCADPVAVAVGDGGAALRSVDGGKTWTAIEVETEVDLRAATLATVRLPGEVRQFVGVIVGDGVLLRSDDAGATWVPVALAPELTGSFRAVEAGWTRIVAVGDGGLAIASTDAGATWTKLDSGTTADLRRLVLERDRVFAATEAGEVVVEGEDLAFETVVPSVPVVDVGLVDTIGRIALFADDRVGPWPEDSPLAQSIALPSTPRALSRGGHELLVGDDGLIAEVFVEAQGGCFEDGVGRPFIVDGAAQAAALTGREDWCATVAVTLTGLDARTRERLAAAWGRDAALEHASVAAFARWIVELLACGAPPALVSAAQAAIADEIEHARLCFGLASAYAGRPVGPDALPVSQSMAVSSDMSQLAVSTLIEGCVGETIAAVEAGYAAAVCADPAVARVLRTIAADEQRHAALAWRALAWALERGGAPVRTAVAAAVATLGVPRQGAEAIAEPARGRLGAAERRELAATTLRAVIAPSARRLLGRREARRASAEPRAQV
ncbi:YCF48-related protein [Nannocystis sp. ILAH1]|uniref:YCF48-related protein n=1 Tax=unclassified Nannocystis TaxID=2627009 RepID=UPI00226F4C55|nr:MULTISPECIES: YCF48-related protein [unclassified Nannocystis]MCY0991069.1 YCF48-related protein [Nannocystis sp. ILAH1]MCY1064581.1 YCF48-related protein [Nannocystis sp. RBIL2]